MVTEPDAEQITSCQSKRSHELKRENALVVELEVDGSDDRRLFFCVIIQIIVDCIVFMFKKTGYHQYIDVHNIPAPLGHNKLIKTSLNN